MLKKKLNSVLVKPAGPDCNFRCGYCFYIKKAERFEKNRSHRMSVDLLEELVKQVMTEGPEQVSFGWQGGEPTLMGLSFFEQVVAFQQQYGRNQQVGNGLQTNGLLIDRSWAKFFQKYSVLVGLSIDGPREMHDQYRLTQGGKGSWQKVVDTAKLLLDSEVSVNALSVVNALTAEHPEEIYNFLKELGFNYLQFIPCLEPNPSHAGRVAPFSITPEQYGIFLIKLFDLWKADFVNGLPSVSIRYFDSLIHLFMGMGGAECTMEKSCGDYLVVEHNGDVYSCDFFVDDEHHLGNIASGKLSEMFNSRQQLHFGRQKTLLAPQCTTCKWLAYCHGGCLKDRLHNPADKSVSGFCQAYKMFFEHAAEDFRTIAKSVQRQIQQPQPYQSIQHTSSHSESSSVKIGRNEPCPCNSGKKYKKCCGK